jgi:choice-of-anchor A domain-containing protein/uncharacterized repeat protein (TIGR01451 family)
MSTYTFRSPGYYDGLTYTNEVITESDVGTVIPFISGPEINGVIGFTNNATGSGPTFNGSAGVYYPNSSEVVNFAYTVTAGAGSLIDSASQLYVLNKFQGPGISLTAVETIYDTSGNLIGTGNYNAMSTTNGPVTLTENVQSIVVDIALTMAIDSTGNATSAVAISGVQQTFNTTVLPPPAPAVSIVESVTSVGGVSGDAPVTYAGEVITYSAVVTNTGNETLTDIVVTEPTLGATPTLATLAPGASVTYTASQIVSQAEIDAGAPITSTTTVTDDQTAPVSSDTVTTTVSQAPSLSIVNTVTTVGGAANDPAATTVGEVIAYAVVITNTGNETLTNLAVTDPAIGGTPVSVASLAVGASVTLAASQTVTQAEIDSGSPISSTATVISDETAVESASATTAVAQAPAVSIATSVTSVGGATGNTAATLANQVIAEAVVITNTGNQTLTNLVVANPTATSTTLGTLASLAPGASATYIASQVVTQAQIDAGAPIVSTTTVTDSQTPAASASADIAVTQAPSVSIAESVTSVGGVAGNAAATYANEAIDYAVVVTNTGNETLTNLSVVDPAIGTALGTLASLAPGASVTYTAVQTVSQTELSSTAPVTNTVTVIDSQTAPASATASTAVNPATGAIGSFVWNDLNANGLQDSSEPGLGGVTVNLLAADTIILAVSEDYYQGNAQFTVDVNGIQVGGTYTATALHSSGNHNFLTLNGDFGNNPTVAVTFLNDLYGGTASTDRNLYVDNIAYNGVVENKSATLDSDGTATLALTGTGGAVLATTKTSSSGAYEFNNLAAGTYEIQFVAPAGDTFTTPNVGTNPALDSSATPGTGVTAPITLTTGEVDNTVDAGLILPADIRSYVYMDVNDDGIMDDSDTFVAGVTIDLLNATTGAVLATTTTNSGGLYTFSNLSPGSYEIEAIAPAGDVFAPQRVTIPAATINNTSAVNQTTGIAPAVTLTSGEDDYNVLNVALQTAAPSISVLKLPGMVAIASGGTETDTFVVTNTGNTALTNIKLTDNTGTAASPITVTPTLVTTGTNGTLAPGASWTYTQTTTQSPTSTSAASNLSASTILQDFNGIVFTNASTPSTIGGAFIAGGNFSGATMYSGPVGSLPTGFGALTVFGSTTGSWINLNDGGKAYVAGTKGAPVNFNGGGGYIGAPPDTMANISAPLIALSSTLSQLAATGTMPATGNNEVIKATPGANGIAVIDLTAAQLAAIPSFSVNLNGASSLIFNVNGSSASVFANDLNATTGDANIIWNFYNATGTVALNTQIGGTVLAPTATVTNANQIDGALVAKAWVGGGALQDVPFTGTLPGSAATASAADTATVTATAPSSTTVTASDTKEVQILDANNNVSVNGTVPTGSLSALYGTPQTMEFLYSPGNTVSSGASGAVTGTNSASSAYLVIENAARSSIYFEGEVTAGEKIYADATINPLTNTAIAGANFPNTDAGQAVFALVYASQAAFQAGAAPVQYDGYSGANGTMHIGDTIGSVQLVGYIGSTGGHLST